jgi:hypothetical protein
LHEDERREVKGSVSSIGGSWKGRAEPLKELVL